MTRARGIWLSAFLPYSRIKGNNGTPDSQLTPPSCRTLHFHRLVVPVGRGLVGYDPCGVFLSLWVMIPWAVILHSLWSPWSMVPIVTLWSICCQAFLPLSF